MSCTDSNAPAQSGISHPTRRWNFCILGFFFTAVISFTSPYLPYRVERTLYDYELNKDTDYGHVACERIAYWQSIKEAPRLGGG